MFNWLYPNDKVVLTPEELATTLSYYKRIHRCHIDVESEARCVQRMKFTTNKPGKYIGLGTKIIEDQS